MIPEKQMRVRSKQRKAVSSAVEKRTNHRIGGESKGAFEETDSLIRSQVRELSRS